MTATNGGPAAVELMGVHKRYGAVEALTDVSLAIPAGQMFGLIGPDGAGKTTTIRLACGLLHADTGTVRVLGHDPVAAHREIARSVGYLSQRFSLYGDLSIDENIAFFAEIHGLHAYDSRRTRLLELTQLVPFRDRLADRLSGGMKQKLALACTLIHEPRLILLDEPTTGVDPVSRREFWKLLSEFLETGITIVISTPYLDEAERCARVSLLHAGRVLAVDTPDALRRSLPGRIVEVVTGDERRAVEALRGVSDVIDVQTFGERVHVRFGERASGDLVQLITSRLGAAGIHGRSARLVPPSLEDVFIARLTEAERNGEMAGASQGRAEARPLH